MSAVHSQRQPLITIVGATGTGKSQLAVELATRFNGEIINGDAMQLYDGLPIITNKMPLEERKNVPHHLLGGISLDEPTWTVSQFVAAAAQKVDEIRSRGRIPILVGGTHYYTQALLFKQSIIEDEPHSQDINLDILEESTEVVLEKLREVDPVMAARWHPNDRRKIQRSLEIWLRTGKRASDVYTDRLTGRDNAVSNTNDADLDDRTNAQTAALRYSSLVFWVYSDRQALHKRLDDRVNAMVRNGLLDEVASLHNYLQGQQRQGCEIDRTRGIWVSIGYKELEAYQIALVSQTADAAQLERLKNAGIEATQAATRQYSNRQGRWIKIKLMNALKDASASNSFSLLDATDIRQYDDNVISPAVAITTKFLNGEALPDPHTLSAVAKEVLSAPLSSDLSTRPDLWENQHCGVCGVTAVTKAQWEKHINSNRHKKVSLAARKRALTAEAKAAHGVDPEVQRQRASDDV